MNGIEMIAEERLRQVSQEGWTPQHDDGHGDFELCRAALCYAEFAQHARPLSSKRNSVPFGWPWNDEWWKPSTDRIRNLVKAGALIAAEIDRLQRYETKHKGGQI